MASLIPFGVGVDRQTGRVLTGFDHVVQSVAYIFSLRFGERVMREWVGSPVVGLLGRLENAIEIPRFFAAVAATLLVFEPRVRVRQIEPLEVTRTGRFRFRIVLEYRPRGHLGDPTPEQALRAINATFDDGRWNTEAA